MEVPIITKKKISDKKGRKKEEERSREEGEAGGGDTPWCNDVTEPGKPAPSTFGKGPLVVVHRNYFQPRHLQVVLKSD